MSFELKFEGAEELSRKLSAALKKCPQAKSRFLSMEAELVTGRAKLLTPVDTGNLRNSWRRTEPAGDGVEIYNNAEYAGHVEFGHRVKYYGHWTGNVVAGKFMLRDALDESAANFAKDGQAIMREIFG